MKLDELKPNLGAGRGIDLSGKNLETSTLVPPGKLPNYPMKSIGVTITPKESK